MQQLKDMMKLCYIYHKSMMVWFKHLMKYVKYGIDEIIFYIDDSENR